MGDTLDFKKLKSITKIRTILNDNVEFKIGKTDDLNRRECQHKNEGYTNFDVIAECTTLEEVDKLETDLVAFFRNYPTCKNKNAGGGGNTSKSEKYYIYLVTK